MTTYTRTHVYVVFADPNLICLRCSQPVDSWHDTKRCGCGDPNWANRPCGHEAGVHSTCPSWGPVDGCECDDHPHRDRKLTAP